MTPRVPDHPEYERLARYFAGECSPQEEAAIQAWIAADDTRRRRVELLHRGWDAAGRLELRGDVDRGWTALSARMDEPSDDRASTIRVSPARRLQPRPTHHASWFVGAGVAATLLVVALGAVAARQLGSKRSGASPAVAQAPVMREVTTKRGQQANVYLSDGTHVVLGVASTLRFPTAFDSARNVDLDGEAYFEVAHDSVRSFAVHTRYGIARDLGTRFAVRSYRDLASATITVTEGSVLLTPVTQGADSILLGATDVGRVSTDGKLSVTRGAHTEQHLAWMTGRLVFDQMPVDEAIAQINRWYDTDVRLGDSTLARLKLSATLTSEPFARAIKIIAGALDARVEHRRSTFTLFSTRGRS